MSGFESLGDPDQFPDVPVTGIRVQDPLYPYGHDSQPPTREASGTRLEQ